MSIQTYLGAYNDSVYDALAKLARHLDKKIKIDYGFSNVGEEYAVRVKDNGVTYYIDWNGKITYKQEVNKVLEL